MQSLRGIVRIVDRQAIVADIGADIDRHRRGVDAVLCVFQIVRRTVKVDDVFLAIEQRERLFGLALGRLGALRQRRERIMVDREIRECGWAVVNIATWPEATVDSMRRG